MLRVRQTELIQILTRHAMWLDKKDGGKRADFTDFSGATVLNASMLGTTI